jgi:hypothetical protein
MRVMKPLPGRILVVLLALTVGIALGAGLAGALRTPAPPNVGPIHLDGERRDEADEGTKKERGKNAGNKDKNGPPPRDDTPPSESDPPQGGAPPPPPPPPPGDDGGDDDGGGGDDDGGGDD